MKRWIICEASTYAIFHCKEICNSDSEGLAPNPLSSLSTTIRDILHQCKFNIPIQKPARNCHFIHRQYNPRKNRAQPFLTVKFLVCEYFSTFQSALSGVPFLLSFQISYFLKIKVSNGLQESITYPQNTVAYQFGEENEMR